ncbi:MAG: AMP-binding protein [Lachnospiraceae bacterium]|nr:AMP-binding protein [Lachnospiraceae bacterium]
MFFEIKSSDRLAVITSNGEKITYAELSEYVNKSSEKLESRKLAFVLCENSPASLISYLVCLNKRIVPLLIDKKIDKDLLENLLKTYDPDYLFVPEIKAEEFKGKYELLDCILNYNLMNNKQPGDTRLYENLALLLTTSGSTGSPKLVRQSYVNIQSNAEAICKYLNLTEDERPVTTLPMNYTYGLSIINSHLQAGATILMTDLPMNMKPFWNFVNNESATSFGGVPFTYEMLKKVGFFKMKVPSIRYMTQAGGKLSPLLHKEFATWAFENDKEFIVMYGQTEATARMAYLPADKSLEKYGSVGIAIPGGKFSIIDVDGNEITEAFKDGELVYKGDNVTLGYAECKEDLTKGDERGGILETGDMAKFDSDGFYYIVGRKKRFLKVFGNRVNLDEVDRIVKEYFENIDCTSAGEDDHLIMFITDETKLSEVRRWLASTTHLSESAFEVRFIESIPRNEAGKVLYKDLPV